MKKWELLKYAYDNYPKGTKFRNLATGVTAESSGIFKISEDGLYCDIKSQDFLYSNNKKYSWNGRWAEIVTYQQPDAKNFIISEDGETLYDGDKYFHVHQVSGVWKLNKSFEHDYAMAITSTSKVITDPDHNKAFSKYDAAINFIVPQMIVVSPNSSYPIHVNRDSIIVQTKDHEPGENLVFTASEMQECLSIYKLLNDENA